MTAPLPLWHGIVLEQMLVGAAASLVNLIIHAVLLGAVVWTVRGLAERDTFAPGVVKYTLLESAVSPSIFGWVTRVVALPPSTGTY